MPDMEWTSEAVSNLRQFWGEGLSTKAIGDRLGTNKNAVVGKAHRLDLPGRPSPIRRDPNATVAPRKPRAPRIGRVSLPRLSSLAGPSLPSLPQLRMRSIPMKRKATGNELKKDAPTYASGRVVATPPQLHPCGCQWIFGEARGKDTKFCGDTITRGPYCADHAAISYIRPRDRREDAYTTQPTKLAA